MKKALSTAMIFCLLWANAAAAVVLDGDTSLSDFKDNKDGLLIGKEHTFDGENGSLTVDGTIPGDTEGAIDCTGNGAPFYFGVQNEGTLNNLASLTADTVINTGKMTVGDINITKTGADAYFMNIGDLGEGATGAEVTINGNINVDSAGWVNNTQGAVMTLNGQNAVIGAELANDYGAVLNINADTTINRSFWNVEGATTNIADGVTLTVTNGFANAFGEHEGGTVNAGGANIIVTGNGSTFSNSSVAEIGSVSVTGQWYGTALNSGTLVINDELNATMSNSGELTYNGTKAIDGSFTNSGNGKLYATNGKLEVTGRFSMVGANSSVGKNENENLTSLTVGDSLTIGNSSSSAALTKLVVENEITANTIENYGTIKTGKLTATEGLDVWYRTNGEASIEVDELVVGGEYASTIGRTRSGTRAYGSGNVIVHDKLTLLGSHQITNYGGMLFDGDNVVISGSDGIIENNGIRWREPGVGPYMNTYGVIAKNENGEKITNLTIEGTLNNTGIVAAKTLNVANGYDRAFEGSDMSGAETFDVDNLNILENGSFALENGTAVEGQNNYYDFTSVGVGSGAALNADGKDINAGNLQNDGTLTASALSLQTGEDNGSLTIEKLVVSDSGDGRVALNAVGTDIETVELREGGNLYVKDAEFDQISGTENTTLTADRITFNDSVNLLGYTVINESITNNAADSRIANLVFGSDSVEVRGSSRLGVDKITLDGFITWQNGGVYKTLNSDSNVDLSNTIVNVDNLAIVGTEGKLAAGRSNMMTLIDNNTGQKIGGGITGTVKQNFTSGTTLQGVGEAAVEGDDVVYRISVSNEAQAQTHAAVMAQTAGLASVIGGYDNIERAIWNMRDDGLNAFASFGGGEYRYDTGSSIKTSDWHLAAGLGVRNSGADGSRTEYGLFYDYGDGNYNTFDVSGRGSGETTYHGGGIFGKHTFAGKLYVEGSFRAGRVENDAKGIFRDALGNGYDLETNSDYAAFHAGVGKVFAFDERDSIDLYGKFFYTHLSGDSFDAGGRYDIDSIDSEIMRFGARWNFKRGEWNHFLGAAYEYEFDGEATGRADGAFIRNSDISGGSVRFEIGTRLVTGNWVIGLNADAYAGQRKGFGGSITAAVTF